MILRPAENRRDAPLWLNWKPITVDFSPWRENQMVMAKMSAEAIERGNAARQKAKDLEVPDFSEALPHDAAWAYNEAIAAKQGMENMLMQGNSQAIMKTPEFAKAYRTYAESVSPARISKLKMEKAAWEDFNKRLEKVGEESAGLLYLDKNGMPINDPTGDLQNAAELHTLRRDYKGYAINELGENIDFRTGVLGSVKEFQKHLSERFGQAGVSKQKFDNAKELANLVNAAESQPDAALLATIKQSVERGGNASQLMSAAQASLKTMGPEQTGAIINAYARTGDYQSRANTDVSKGGFRVNGAISPELVWKAAFTEPKHETSLRLGDKKEKVDFATAFVVDEGARFLSDSDLISSDLITLKGRKPTSGAGSEKGLVNVMAWWQNVGAGMEFNPYTGAKQPIGKKQPLTIVHDVLDQYGTVVGKDAREIDVYTEKLPRNVIRQFEEEIGLVDKEGNRKTSVDEFPEVSQVFPNTEFMIANGGKVHNTTDLPEGLKVRAIYPQVTMIADDIEYIREQMAYGETDFPSNRPGGMSPYFTVELETTSNMTSQLTDFVKGLDGIQEVPIDSPVYGSSYPKGVKEGSEGFNWTGPNGRIVKVFVKASVGDMQQRGSLLINENEIGYRADPVIQENSAETNYRSSIQKAGGYTGPMTVSPTIESRPGDLPGTNPYQLPAYVSGGGNDRWGGGSR